MAVRSYRDSIAWQKAMVLSELVHEATKGFPKEELFGLTNQLRRASVSVASNIAEGQGRLTSGEFAHFLGIARGSVLEVETQLELAGRLSLGSQEHLFRAAEQANEVCKIINAVLANLRQRKNSRQSS